MKLHVILFSVMLVASGCGEWPGGMRPTYPARDNDLRLTKHARTAVPLIRALEAYRNRTSLLPSSLVEIAEMLPAEQSPEANTPNQWRGWWYAFRENEYTLTRKLGWDPVLIYRSSDASWEFNPGDGSPGRCL